MLLKTSGQVSERPFDIRPDPRSAATEADWEAQFDFLIECRDKLTEIHRAIKQIRYIKTQVRAFTERLENQQGADEIREAKEALVKKISKIEEILYQTKNQSRQDPLNFPIRLNNKLAALAGTASLGYNRPTASMFTVKKELTDQINTALESLQAVIDTDIPMFNRLVKTHDLPAIFSEHE